MNELTKVAKTKVEELVSFFGINADVRVHPSEEGIIELEILNGDATARLIGHRGETLRAIEHIVNMMVKRSTSDFVRVNVDVAGYKRARAASLEALAKEAAERVIASGNEEELAPMNPADRRIVHMALRDLPGITTESRGEATDRRIVILKATD